MKLTAPQLAALRYYATEGYPRYKLSGPRANVRDRLVRLGLLTVRTAMVRTGTTYRSRQRLAVVDVHVTDAGRALLAETKEN